MSTLVKTTLLLISLNNFAAYAHDRPVEVQSFSIRCAVFYAQAYHVPLELVAAVIQAESNWNPDAVSNKGAAGLMQLMPATAARFRVRNRFDIEENIRGGVAYLAWLIHLFHGDLRLAVAAYQVGEAPILRRGLAYSSAQVFEYVSRVARIYSAIRERVASPTASYLVLARNGDER
jgi:soluble lytic murein transglycosylase-like protein